MLAVDKKQGLEGVQVTEALLVTNLSPNNHNLIMSLDLHIRFNSSTYEYNTFHTTKNKHVLYKYLFIFISFKCARIKISRR